MRWASIGLAAIVGSAVVPSVAVAHGFAIYVSTPITPPASFEWMRIVSAVVIGLAVFLAIWLIARSGPAVSLLVAVCGTLVFWYTLVFLGRLAASRSTLPHPGLGPPSGIYWHWRDFELWSLFARWNITGAFVLAVSTFVIGRLWRVQSRRRMILAVVVPVVSYLALLVPFVQSRAIAHGWAGGYVMMAGEEQLLDLNRACFRYAKDHGGLLPTAGDIDDLVLQVEKYTERKEPRCGNPITVHPAAWAFEKEPKPFVWNVALSGKPAPSLPVRDIEDSPVTCPYVGMVYLRHDLCENENDYR